MFENVKRIAIAAAVVGGVAVAAAVYAQDTGRRMGSGGNMMAPGMMQDGGMAGMMQDGGMPGMMRMMSMMAKMGPMMDACTRMMEDTGSAPSGGHGPAGKTPESKKGSEN